MLFNSDPSTRLKMLSWKVLVGKTKSHPIASAERKSTIQGKQIRDRKYRIHKKAQKNSKNVEKANKEISQSSISERIPRHLLNSFACHLRGGFHPCFSNFTCFVNTFQMTNDSVVLGPPWKELFNLSGLHCSEVLKTWNSITAHRPIWKS